MMPIGISLFLHFFAVPFSVLSSYLDGKCSQWQLWVFTVIMVRQLRGKRKPFAGSRSFNSDWPGSCHS